LASISSLRLCPPRCTQSLKDRSLQATLAVKAFSFLTEVLNLIMLGFQLTNWLPLQYGQATEAAERKAREGKQQQPQPHTPQSAAAGSHGGSSSSGSGTLTINVSAASSIGSGSSNSLPSPPQGGGGGGGHSRGGSQGGNVHEDRMRAIQEVCSSSSLCLYPNVLICVQRRRGRVTNTQQQAQIAHAIDA
jgi:hypothetical protein